MERVKLSRKLYALPALGVVAAVIGGLGLFPLVRESIEIGRLGDPETRGAALQALRESRSRRAVPHLVALLDEEDHFFRWDVLEALEAIGLEGQAEPVAEAIFALTDETPQLKELCSRCVERSRGFVPALLSRAVLHCDVSNPDDGMAPACVTILDFLSTRHDASLPYVESYLHGTPDGIRLALHILAEIGEPANGLCRSVVELLLYEDASVRSFVGHALRELGCCEAASCDRIAAAAGDEEIAVRGWIASLMAKKCEPCRSSWITALRSLLRDPFMFNRFSAVQAIGDQGFIRELEQELCEVMASDPDEEVRVTCAILIWGAKEEERFVNCAEAALPKASGDTRYALATLLYKVRPSAELRPIVEQARSQGSGDVMERARELLEPGK